MGREKFLESQVSVKTCTIATTCTFLCSEDPSHLHHNPSLMEIPPNRCLQRLILWALQPGGRLRCCSASVRTLAVVAEAQSSLSKRHVPEGTWGTWLLTTTQADVCRLENDEDIEGHNALKAVLQGKGFLMLKKTSWIIFCAGLLCKHKTWLPHRTHSWNVRRKPTQDPDR